MPGCYLKCSHSTATFHYLCQAVSIVDIIQSYVMRPKLQSTNPGGYQIFKLIRYADQLPKKLQQIYIYRDLLFAHHLHGNSHLKVSTKPLVFLHCHSCKEEMEGRSPLKNI